MTDAMGGAESDPAALNSAEDLDEDRMAVDPLEKGVEPPEHWTEADRFGMTPSEQREGETLDERLAEERPDVEEPVVPERPVAATPATELDGSVDEDRPDLDTMPAEEPPGVGQEELERQNADRAGGSVAEAIRTPESED